MKKLTRYQQEIFSRIKAGARLQCTEGPKYKTWLVYPNGQIETVRRNSAQAMCDKCESALVFGHKDGIYYRGLAQ